MDILVYSSNFSVYPQYTMYLVKSDMKEEGRVLIGEVVVGVAEGAWPLKGAWPLGAVDENSSHAEMTNRL